MQWNAGRRLGGCNVGIEVAIISGLATAGAAYVTATAFTFTIFAKAFAVGFTLSLLSQQLLKPPKQQGVVSRDRNETLRTTTAPRRLLYGEVQVGGHLVFFENSDNNDTCTWL